jgi:hypothetical protein
LPETVTESVELESQTDAVFLFTSNASHIPAWAPNFAPRISQLSENVWNVDGPQGNFLLQVTADQRSGTIDFTREVRPGVNGGAYLRVIPKAGGGSVVTMTAPIPSGSTQERVRAILCSELQTLRRLVDDGR